MAVKSGAKICRTPKDLATNMTHSEFRAGYQAGLLKVHADRVLANKAMESSMMPRRFRAAHLFWTWLWFLSFPAAISLFIWHRWWSAVLVFWIALFPLRSAIARSACEFGIEFALEDVAFYLAATDAKALVVRQKDEV